MFGATALTVLPSPKRIVDSRLGFGSTDDGQQQRFGAVTGTSTRTIPVAGRVGVAATADKAVLSVVAVAPRLGGYLTIYPCGAARSRRPPA